LIAFPGEKFHFANFSPDVAGMSAYRVAILDKKARNPRFSPTFAASCAAMLLFSEW